MHPGFPVGGGANPPEGGRQHTNFPDFPKNCMKLRKFWSVGGLAGVPLGYATVLVQQKLFIEIHTYKVKGLAIMLGRLDVPTHFHCLFRFYFGKHIYEINDTGSLMTLLITYFV